MYNSFGAQTINLEQSDKVDKQLKEFFSLASPTFVEQNQFILLLVNSGVVTLEQVNRVGHNFSLNPIIVPVAVVPGPQPIGGNPHGGNQPGGDN